MIAVFTGTREEGQYDCVFNTLNLLQMGHGRQLTVFVGDCPTGVDAAVRGAAERLGVDTTVFQAWWRPHGRAAGPRRNGCMVKLATLLHDAGERVEVYYRASFDGSRGTRDCVTKASEAGLTCRRLGGPKL